MKLYLAILGTFFVGTLSDNLHDGSSPFGRQASNSYGSPSQQNNLGGHQQQFGSGQLSQGGGQSSTSLGSQGGNPQQIGSGKSSQERSQASNSYGSPSQQSHGSQIRNSQQFGSGQSSQGGSQSFTSHGSQDENQQQFGSGQSSQGGSQFSTSHGSQSGNQPQFGSGQSIQEGSQVPNSYGSPPEQSHGSQIINPQHLIDPKVETNNNLEVDNLANGERQQTNGYSSPSQQTGGSKGSRIQFGSGQSANGERQQTNGYSSPSQQTGGSQGSRIQFGSGTVNQENEQPLASYGDFLLTTDEVIPQVSSSINSCANKSGKFDNQVGSDSREEMKRQLIPLLLLVLTINTIPCMAAAPKDARLISLLNVELASPAGECGAMGGRVDGTCASGFGACCVFTLTACTGSIANNCTYIMNPGSPGNFNGMDNMCRYTFAQGNGGICRIRLDFQNFVINTPMPDGTCPVEKFTVTSTSRNNIPNFCGTLTNQHMYITTPTGPGDLGTLTINFDTTLMNANRRWNIKVTRIHCSDTLSLPPDAQSYNSCIRQERDFCSLQLTESSTAIPDPFEISGGGPNVCLDAKLLISNGDPNIICGQKFLNPTGKTSGQIIANTSPFILRLETKTPLKIAPPVTGFNLNYNQIPC
ncbi:unnamed protein product [Lepeophtheirus salmonis]|uniref:(salmon louse) hypothetical protein n=1 Tax=Lepeophtheirus salmonis TaxID=72036 RepID=A0A7R8H6G2_LEPSM|nr:unnamed protein product [Lepeophtheirus salmonis]CAF2896461.1 unnamed protein product [Lepeophtheirus salmonis]